MHWATPLQAETTFEGEVRRSENWKKINKKVYVRERMVLLAKPKKSQYNYF